MRVPRAIREAIKLEATRLTCARLGAAILHSGGREDVTGNRAAASE